MKHLLLSLALLALGCESTTPGWLAVPGPTTRDGVEVAVDGVVRGTTWISAVTGTATLLSGPPLSRCEISFEAYDMHGRLRGTARAVRDGMEEGETWEFEAKFPARIDDASTLSSPNVRVTR